MTRDEMLCKIIKKLCTGGLNTLSEEEDALLRRVLDGG
jgi:hypothetical protein